MYHLIYKASIVLGLFILLGCTSLGSSTPPLSQAPPLPLEYTGPKALLAVLDFEDETSSAGTFDSALGRSMRTMLQEALVKSKRFLVLDLDISDFTNGAYNSPRQEPASKPGKPTKARAGRQEALPSPVASRPPAVMPDIVVVGAVTSFEPDAGGGTLKTGGLPLASRGSNALIPKTTLGCIFWEVYHRSANLEDVGEGETPHVHLGTGQAE